MKLIGQLAICFTLSCLTSLDSVKAKRCDVKGLTAATIETCGGDYLLNVQYKTNQPVKCDSELTVKQAKRAPVSVRLEVDEVCSFQLFPYFTYAYS